jgi:ABC-type glycerol-3-phosphate transport system permease component
MNKRNVKQSKILNKHERKNQRIAIVLLALFIIPIILIYFSFFRLSFFSSQTGDFTWSNFRFLYTDFESRNSHIPAIGQSMKNTILFTIVVTIFEVSISSLTGYTLSRMDFKGKNFIQKLLLILRMFPNLLLLIGVLYVLMSIKLSNTLAGVILVAIAFRLPGSTFIIKNHFDSIPRDIENSCLVDGCNRFTAFTQVIIHLVKPGLASISVFSFLSAWSNYILFTTLIFNAKTPVVATYLRSLAREEQMVVDYNTFAAMSIIYMIPVIVFFIISQKALMEGNEVSSKGV